MSVRELLARPGRRGAEPLAAPAGRLTLNDQGVETPEEHVRSLIGYVMLPAVVLLIVILIAVATAIAD